MFVTFHFVIGWKGSLCQWRCPSTETITSALAVYPIALQSFNSHPRLLYMHLDPPVPSDAMGRKNLATTLGKRRPRRLKCLQGPTARVIPAQASPRYLLLVAVSFAMKLGRTGGAAVSRGDNRIYVRQEFSHLPTGVRGIVDRSHES